MCDDCDKAVDVRPEVHLHHIAVLQDGVRLYEINNTLTTKARREKGLGRTDGRTATTEQALLPFSPAHLDGVLYFVFTKRTDGLTNDHDLPFKIVTGFKYFFC